MTAQDALDIATGVALLSVAAFLIVYAVRARETWWSDPLGRAIMLGGFAVGGLAAVGSARRIDTRIESIDLAHEIAIASTIGMPNSMECAAASADAETIRCSVR